MAIHSAILLNPGVSERSSCYSGTKFHAKAAWIFFDSSLEPSIMKSFKRCAIRLVVPALLLGLSSSTASFAQETKDVATWVFQHPKDPFNAKALLDLRFLNEKEAGETGYLKLAADGNSFVKGDGKPIRLWAVGSDIYKKESKEGMARHARFLAKIGVNMVRIHTQIAPGPKGSKLTDVDQTEIDKIWQFVAALKKEGIYVTISPYWPTKRDVANWGIDGLTGPSELWGLLFFDTRLQEGYKAWAKALYAPKNPYTGIPLAQDPAVGIIQVQNEDSLFFWTTMGMKPALKERFGKKFGEWLVKKYGSLAKAKEAWDGTANDKDDFANGKVGILNVWHMTQTLKGGIGKRVRDETEFYARTQYQFYQQIGEYYRKDLGCKQLLNASNWTTADAIKLNDVERWTYTALDVLAVNRYTGGLHVGDQNGWRIDPGHHFTNQSCLTDPRALPTDLKQVVGHPMVITESTWVSPEGYQSEGPFLIAAYQSLTGVSGYYWFSATAPEYDLDPSIRFLNMKGQHPIFKWSCSTPTLMGNFPAAALMYRKGYVRQGEAVVHEERPLVDLWERKVPLIAEDRSFDPNRYEGATGVEKSHFTGGADPLAFLVGRIEIKYGGDPNKTAKVDLSKYHDKDKKVVRSITDEIRLDYGNGLCTVDAAKVQGASGFLSKAGAIKLKDVAIASGNDYATVILVSMDDQPLNTSQKILVQTGTSARLTGWKSKAAEFKGDRGKTIKGYEIVSTGLPPWRIVNTDVTLVVNNANLKKATLLDTAGYVVKTIDGASKDGKFSVTLPADALYVVLE
jgi:hypothetical protein